MSVFETHKRCPHVLLQQEQGNPTLHFILAIVHIRCMCVYVHVCVGTWKKFDQAKKVNGKTAIWIDSPLVSHKAQGEKKTQHFSLADKKNKPGQRWVKHYLKSLHVNSQRESSLSTSSKPKHGATVKEPRWHILIWITFGKCSKVYVVPSDGLVIQSRQWLEFQVQAYCCSPRWLDRKNLVTHSHHDKVKIAPLFWLKPVGLYGFYSQCINNHNSFTIDG